MVELKEITKDNLDDVLNLKVAEHQTSYVSSTVHSLAQAYVLEGYNEEIIIHFVSKQIWIYLNG